MRYMIQIFAMISDLVIYIAVLAVLYGGIKSGEYLFTLLVCSAGICASCQNGGLFFSWRPKNIKQFMDKAKKIGL